MIDRNIFKTRIDRKHEFGNNSFIKGKILGIAEALDITRNEEGIPYAVGRNDECFTIKTLCTNQEYAKFREIVERNYGDGKFEGLVEFDV